MEINKIYCENCRVTIERMKDNSIDCLITSPPYWSLRDYGEEAVTIWDSNNGCLHKWGDDIDIKRESHHGQGKSTLRNGNVKSDEQWNKGVANKKQPSNYCLKCGAWRGSLGLEPDFNLYIKHLCDIFDLFMPKLKKTGTIWVNLGDTYYGGGKSEGDSTTGKLAIPIQNMPGGSDYKNMDYQNKCLCCVPDRFKIEMINRGWICRNEIIWHKPNCMPSSAKDRFTVDFEKMFFFTKSQRYYFEQQFDPYKSKVNRWGGDVFRGSSHKYIEIGEPKLGKFGATSMYRKGRPVRPNKNGKNKRCVWTIQTKGTADVHFAIYPEKLIKPCILAGCIEGGIVYDPFGGSGTTADVCIRLNRNFILSEINPGYVNEIAQKRIKREQSKLTLF